MTAKVSSGPLVEDGLLTWHTSRSSISVDPADGGRLVSLTIDEIEVIGRTVAPDGFPPEIFHGSFLMAPFVGRTANGTFAFEGEVYQLPVNLGHHAIHGFTFDRPWTVTDGGIEIELDDRWPFGGTVRQSFSLSESSLVVTAEIRNESRSMPALLGFHPWFRYEVRPGERAQYEFHPRERYACDAEGIPFGTTSEVGTRPWDDSFRAVASPPTISWPGGPELTIGLTGSHWIACETMPDAFCIEPLTGPVNGLARGEFDVVRPGSPLIHTLSISWT